MKKKLESSCPSDATTCSLVFVAMDREFRMSSGCPYCRAKMTATVDGWTQEDDGTWSAHSVELHCAKEPDIDHNSWWQWCHDHCDSDYGAAWNAMQERVIASLRKRFRFNPENS